MEQNSTNPVEYDTAITVFSVLMSLIVTVGLLGNIATIFVLVQPEQRTKNIMYLMLNLAISDIIICIIGYPVAIDLHSTFLEGSLSCDLNAFFTATTGIACIITLTVMSISQYQSIRQITMPASPGNFSSKKRKALVIVAIWSASIGICIPPIFGWNRFVPVQSGCSCHPDWDSQDPGDKAYIWYMVNGGFFIPLTVICVSYGMMFRLMQQLSVGQIGDRARKRRLTAQRAINRMIIAAISAFILSWSPYCIVSLMANFKGSPVTAPEMSLVPELFAKASVIYNPIIFISFNKSFRKTLVRLVSTCLDRLLCWSFNMVVVTESSTGKEIIS